ncbi:MAG: glutaredoxin domain-containing protein [Candidatus Margulisiibacteriota bacterium]|nr:glutaredoxin domain-containing protein [Candidatus Margulisiibacteriota bacterium]
MKLILKAVRLILGEFIVFLNWLFKPSAVRRSATEQAQLDQRSEALSLYQFRGCPFCVKVRREITRLNLVIKYCDVNRHESYRSELESGGGKVKVPCLKIQTGESTEWLYESSDINRYLAKFALSS